MDPLIQMDPSIGPDSLGLSLLMAAQNHQWSLALATLLILASFVSNKFGVAIAKARNWPTVIAVLESDAGRLAVVFVGSLGGALAATLSAGQRFSGPILLSALVVALKAIGGFQVVKKVLGPLAYKALGIAAPAAILALVFLPGRARAECPVSTVSHGLSGTFDKLQLSGKEKGLVQKVSIGAGYSVQLNVLPTSDCSVRWVSLIAAAQLGGGQAANASAGAFTITPLAGIGIYNSLVRVLVGFDLLNASSASLTGLLAGNPIAGNFALFIGSGLNFDLISLLPGALGAEASRRPPAPGYVRL